MSFELDEFLPYRLNVAAARVSRRFAARYGSEAGLSIPEWRVLAHMNQSGTVSVRDIHVKVHLDKSMVSRAAARLEEAGYIRKSENQDDRRLVALELTDRGRELMQRLGRIAERFQNDLFTELGNDAEAMNRGLSRLIGEDS